MSTLILPDVGTKIGDLTVIKRAKVKENLSFSAYYQINAKGDGERFLLFEPAHIQLFKFFNVFFELPFPHIVYEFYVESNEQYGRCHGLCSKILFTDRDLTRLLSEELDKPYNAICALAAPLPNMYHSRCCYSVYNSPNQTFEQFVQKQLIRIWHGNSNNDGSWTLNPLWTFLRDKFGLTKISSTMTILEAWEKLSIGQIEQHIATYKNLWFSYYQDSFGWNLHELPHPYPARHNQPVTF